MQTILIGTPVNVGFATQIDLMDRQRYMRLDTTNKQQPSFPWRGPTMTKVCLALTVPNFTHLLVANAHRKEIEEEEAERSFCILCV